VGLEKGRDEIGAVDRLFNTMKINRKTHCGMARANIRFPTRPDPPAPPGTSRLGRYPHSKLTKIKSNRYGDDKVHYAFV